MDEQTKDVLDIAAGSTALMTMIAWLPPVASLLTVVWLGIRIYESDTVQKVVHGKNQLDKQD